MPEIAVSLALTLGVVQKQVLGKNPQRVYALVVNNSAEEIFLGLGIPAVLDQGIPLLISGSNYEISLVNPWHGSISAISRAGTPTLLITEW